MQLIAGKQAKRVGMLGLGVGTIAAYSEPGDYFRAYEINQQVIEIATNPDIFTFWSVLEMRGAKGEIVLGDARLSLDRELQQGLSQNFDILTLDVFSGDAIPVHLLSIQAFETYFKHLATHGMLAVHISNHYLDLVPVVRSAASRFPVNVAFVADPFSEWLILGSPEVIKLLADEHPKRVQVLSRKTRNSRVWTDDYSDIFSVLK
jgi:spermidine synthase